MDRSNLTILFNAYIHINIITFRIIELNYFRNNNHSSFRFRRLWAIIKLNQPVVNVRDLTSRRGNIRLFNIPFLVVIFRKNKYI